MDGGVWRTVGGRRIFIKDGQSLSDAMKDSGKFKIEMTQLKDERIKLDASFNDLDENIQNRIKGELNYLTDNYKEALDYYERLDIQVVEMSDNTFAYMTDNNTMVINSKMFENEELLSKAYIKSSTEDKWNQEVPKGKEIEGIITHEYGHYYQNYLHDLTDVDDIISKHEYADAFLESVYTKVENRGSNFFQGNQVSGYAMTSSREFFAEMFTKMRYNDSDDVVMKTFKEELKKALGGK